MEDRQGLKSTLMTSQYPVQKWYELIGEPTLADAVLDRIVHVAHRSVFYVHRQLSDLFEFRNSAEEVKSITSLINVKRQHPI
jgi:DNA replication protein DnaC